MTKTKIKKVEFEPEVKVISNEEQLWRYEKEVAETKLKQLENALVVTKAFIELAKSKMNEAENNRGK